MERVGRGSLFEGLPPPATNVQPESVRPQPHETVAPRPVIRESVGASKRGAGKFDSEGVKKVRFKSSEVEASEEQILGAMSKIASHIGNPEKFSKASKLALQLLQAGSVKADTSKEYFEILRAAMGSPSQATDGKLWMDYHALFSAVMQNLEAFVPPQQAKIEVWELWAVLANEFRTDDSFVFSKASARVRQFIDLLPEAKEDNRVEDDDCDRDLSGHKASSESGAKNSLLKVPERGGGSLIHEDVVESDPFGLNALMPRLSKKEERVRRKKEEEAANLEADRTAARLLNERREALIMCLRIASDHYKLQWAQTSIDILVKHASDSLTKFTDSQRHVVTQLWGCIREQLMGRKHGKLTSGKLDVTSFEHLQSLYAHEHISIRRAVGSSGERSAEQWLG